jgi:hypothetical protein
LKLTESQFQRIFEDKRYWRQVWLEIVSDTARENQRQIQIREAGHGPRTVSSSSRFPQRLNDSEIGRASSFPLSEFQQRIHNIVDDTLQKLRDHPGQSCQIAHPDQTHDEWRLDNKDEEEVVEENKLHVVPRFDGAYEVQTIKPSRGSKYLRPETRNPVQVLRFDTVGDRPHGPDPSDPNAKHLLEKWNRGKQPDAQPAGKMLIWKKRKAVKE